nr:hypothetical protein Iba_chr05cCG18950 [Ipomoea batatas]
MMGDALLGQHSVFQETSLLHSPAHNMQNNIEGISQKPHQRKSVQHLEEEISFLSRIKVPFSLLSLQELGEFLYL